jgi:hypothetical protein
MGETCGHEPFSPNEFGGALKRLALFGQDAKGRKANESSCTKHQQPRKKLAPGIQV